MNLANLGIFMLQPSHMGDKTLYKEIEFTVSNLIFVLGFPWKSEVFQIYPVISTFTY